MISRIRKYTKQNHITKSEYIPPFLTWSIITFILCFAFFTRMIVSTGKAEESVMAFSEQGIILDDQQLGMKQEVDWIFDPILELYCFQDDNYDYNLLASVKENILTIQIILEQNELQLLQSKMLELREITGSERVSDLRSMSLEGRRQIIDIIREILSIYDYQLIINEGGEIEEIVDQSGSIVYSRSAINTGNIHYNGLITVLFVLVIAMILCIQIAKKNQLFVKEVSYDGFNTKRYA